MNRLLVRLTVSILLTMGLTMMALVYLVGEILDVEWTFQSRLFLVISFLISFLFLSFFISYLLQKTIKPLEGITAMVKDLSQGHYWRRMYPRTGDDVFEELTTHTNRLAAHLQEATEKQAKNEDRLQAVIRHMDSGLLFVNQKGRIVLTNQSLMDMLHWERDYQREIYYQTPIPEEMIAMIRDAFSYETELRKHITIEVGIKRMEADVFAAPVQDLQGIMRGVVLVLHDITDLKNLENVRKDFVSNVSHELKTPLTSIKGFTETLLDGAMDNEEHLHQFLQIIHKESDRLHRLIQDLLELSHIEQDEFQLYWNRLDLTEIVEDTILVLKERAERKQIQLQFEYHQPAYIEGDADRIRQILLNLISNSIQYTPEDGQVEVSIQAWGDKGYSVCVADNGVGIEEKQLSRLFERFYRVSKDRSRGSGGTGLGLAIVKHLVEAHHGEIHVESVVGKGSQFCVYFYTRKPDTRKPESK